MMRNKRNSFWESMSQNRDAKVSPLRSRWCSSLLVVLLLVLGCGPAAAQCDVYVANRESNSVSVFNTLTDGLEAMIPVGNQPLRVAITPNRAFAYVTNSALRRNPAGWLIE